MTERIVTDSNGRKHITNEPLLHPPKRLWVGLTDEQWQVIADTLDCVITRSQKNVIEAKLKGNT